MVIHFFAPYHSNVQEEDADWVRYDIKAVPKLISDQQMTVLDRETVVLLVDQKGANLTSLVSGNSFYENCKRRDSHLFRALGDEYHCSNNLEMDNTSEHVCLLSKFIDLYFFKRNQTTAKAQSLCVMTS